MSLQPGQSLLHYRLIDKIGEGGMGVVWKALDTTLEREVAIKILPEAFAAEAERLTRFEREARVLASLNHPHISGIYGIHEGEGKRFLSMELIPGEDLSTLLARGPQPIERMLKIAREIAEALEAAHEHGVIHRDLKPANVRLTPDGKAKVLDFGLAKAYDPATASDPMTSQTMTSAGTVAGLIIGTAAYMSPEQASGQPTDRRADIWSFGVMLHEMFSGKPLFGGETVSHTLADVLRAPIELGDLPASTPTRIRQLIERCLDRDKMRRLRDIGEARIVLDDVLARPEAEARTGASAAGPAKSSSRLPWIVAGLALVAAVTGFAWKPAPAPTKTEPTRRFSLEVPNSGNSRQGDGCAIAISSDGESIVTRGGAGTDDMLYRRSINEFESQPIEGTQSGRYPFFSPDDRWIGFLTATRLVKVRASGGPPIEIGKVPATLNGMQWADDGYIYYGHQGRIWKISENGGTPEAITDASESGSERLAYPFALPGTRALICSTTPGATGRLFALDPATGELKDLDQAGTDPRYLPTGHIVFARGGSIFSVPFDAERVEIVGEPTAVLPRAWIDQSQMQIDIAHDGTVAYLPAAGDESQALVSVGLDGQTAPLLPEGLPFSSFNDPRISRDGRRLLVTVGGSAIWMIDLDTQTPTLMTEEGFYPQWSPDGNRIIYGSSRGESFDIYIRDVDLSRPETILLDIDNNLRSADWTRGGTVIIREELPEKGMDLRYMTDLDKPELQPLMESEDDELAPVVSLDEKWMAFVSNYSGNDEVYVTTYPETGARMQVSIKGGTSPTWAPDGSAIYYFEGTSLVEVSIETEPRFRVTDRKTLFEGQYVQYRWSRQYDITPDGSRFILVKTPARGNVEIITNWFAELP